jgi:hypothetical protein
MVKRKIIMFKKAILKRIEEKLDNQNQFKFFLAGVLECLDNFEMYGTDTFLYIEDFYNKNKLLNENRFKEIRKETMKHWKIESEKGNFDVENTNNGYRHCYNILKKVFYKENKKG